MLQNPTIFLFCFFIMTTNHSKSRYSDTQRPQCCQMLVLIADWSTFHFDSFQAKQKTENVDKHKQEVLRSKMGGVKVHPQASTLHTADHRCAPKYLTKGEETSKSSQRRRTQKTRETFDL